MFPSIFARKTPWTPKIPAMRRVYAIGDIHGRLDLFETALAAAKADHIDRGRARTVVVLLGDLIDRGPASAAVVARAMQPLDWADLVCLKGNHEAAMEAALDGDLELATIWLRNGGVQALESWGVDAAVLADDAIEPLLAAARATIPEAQREWLRSRPVNFRVGDYLFVHAGIRPGVPLDRQTLDDQLWIRDEFLNSRSDHGVMVVHGHTITNGIVERPNRIGIDTGAYLSGRLSVLGIEGEEHWLIPSKAAALPRPPARGTAFAELPLDL